MKIPFNKPFIIGKELFNIAQSVVDGQLSGDGKFTKKCHAFFEDRFSFQKVLLTSSCTDALEMTAILANIQTGDEVIAPSYTFVSTVNAFALRGAKIVFCDSKPHHPNIDEKQIENLITSRTKAIVIVHYAGIACDMDQLLRISSKYQLFLIEDAAQAINSFYKGKPLGSIGQFGTLSFHETKNVISGEGGLLIINDSQFNHRAEIIREKGTNRSAFFRGEVDKYQWVDIGSSFLPSDIIAAFLYAQLEELDKIQNKRLALWERYYTELKLLEDKGIIQLPIIPDYATNNAHLFYILCNSLAERTKLIEFMKKENINPVFHYLSLHKSLYYAPYHDQRELPNADRFSDCLLRLPMYYELTETEIQFVVKKIYDFYQ